MAKILGFEFGGKKEEIKKETIVINKGTSLSGSFGKVDENYSFINPVSSAGYVKFGKSDENMELLKSLYENSPMHANIILTKSRMVIGEGIEFVNSGQTQIQNKLFESYLNFADGSNSLESIALKLSFDYQLYAWAAIMVTWDMTFSKIIKIKRINPEYLKFGEPNENDETTYFYYSKNWNKSTTKYQVIPAFDIMNKENYNQIILIKNPSSLGVSYPTPNYISGLNWIQASAQIGVYQNRNIQNNFSPGMAIHFYNRPEDSVEAETIWNKIQMEYKGAKNAGKTMMFFNDSKENKVDVEPIKTTDLPEQYIAVADQISENIVIAHGVTSPIIVGIKSDGKLGSTNEYQNAYKIFEKTSLSSDRYVLESALNRINKINGFPLIKFQPFIIFDNQIQSPTSKTN